MLIFFSKFLINNPTRYPADQAYPRKVIRNPPRYSADQAYPRKVIRTGVVELYPVLVILICEGVTKRCFLSCHARMDDLLIVAKAKFESLAEGARAVGTQDNKDRGNSAVVKDLASKGGAPLDGRRALELRRVRKRYNVEGGGPAQTGPSSGVVTGAGQHNGGSSVGAKVDTKERDGPATAEQLAEKVDIGGNYKGESAVSGGGPLPLNNKFPKSVSDPNLPSLAMADAAPPVDPDASTAEQQGLGATVAGAQKAPSCTWKEYEQEARMDIRVRYREPATPWRKFDMKRVETCCLEDLRERAKGVERDLALYVHLEVG